MKKFEVNVVYSGNLVYIVEAEDAQGAKELACLRYHNGDEGDLIHSEEEYITQISSPIEINS